MSACQLTEQGKMICFSVHKVKNNRIVIEFIKKFHIFADR